jgi:putative sterol carrier protein
MPGGDVGVGELPLEGGGAGEPVVGVDLAADGVEQQGEATRADVRLRLSWQDWADIVGQRLDPARALVTGRLRPRGNPLALLRLGKVFPRA